jgi:hypothetical protein
MRGMKTEVHEEKDAEGVEKGLGSRFYDCSL